MLIYHSDIFKGKLRNNLTNKNMFAWFKNAKPPMHVHAITLKPNQVTKAHNHYNAEAWIILKGDGVLQLDQENITVIEGDVIYLKPICTHSIKNISDKNNLLFLSIWWENMDVFNVEISKKQSSPKSNNKRVFVLPSFPTPNGDLHLGHLAGPYLAADVYKRYQKILGNAAYYLLGTVGHQTHVTCKGDKLKLSFYETAEKYTDDIIKTLSSMKIQYDIFVRPKALKNFNSTLHEFFNELYKKKYIVIRYKQVIYCGNCQKYLFEASVTGICPICNANGSGSNECEVCGYLHEDQDLINPICNTCKSPASYRNLRRLFFKLEPFRNKLLQYYKTAKISIGLKVFLEKVFSKELLEIPITHVTDNGVSVPLSGWDDQRVYSLFEIPSRYICSVKELIDQHGLSQNWKQLCTTTNVALFFGFDNAYLRSIIFPSILMAYDQSMKLADLLVMNEFYKLDNKKFSTSREHAIWGKDIVKLYSSDAIRFFLAFTRPEVEQTNFTMSYFENIIDNELCGEWDTWLNEIRTKIMTYYDGIAPEAGNWFPEAKEFYCNLKEIFGNTIDEYESVRFSLQNISRLLSRLVHCARNFGKATQHIYTLLSLSSEARTCIALELLAARSLAILSMPIMPEFAEMLLYGLGYSINNHTPTVELTWLPPGHKCTYIPHNYFTKSVKKENINV